MTAGNPCRFGFVLFSFLGGTGWGLTPDELTLLISNTYFLLFDEPISSLVQ